MRCRALACLFAIFIVPAHADTTGRAAVIDGDTIEIRGESIRLDAIDAPESGQTCEAAGQPWRCGQQAALALADMIGAANVRCADRGTDRYDRTLAICTLGDLDLNGWLVAEGWALAYRYYSTGVPIEHRGKNSGSWNSVSCKPGQPPGSSPSPCVDRCRAPSRSSNGGRTQMMVR